jgi:CspA family cold shock protein
MESQKHLGKVAWFDSKKGYGFITRDGETDIFVHWSDIVSEGYKFLKKDSVVEFSIGLNKRSQPKATEVSVVEQ